MLVHIHGPVHAGQSEDMTAMREDARVFVQIETAVILEHHQIGLEGLDLVGRAVLTKLLTWARFAANGRALTTARELLRASLRAR